MVLFLLKHLKAEWRVTEKILLKEMAERRKEGGEGKKEERTGRKSNRRINCGKILLSLSMIDIGKVILAACFHFKPLFIKKNLRVCFVPQYIKALELF